MLVSACEIDSLEHINPKASYPESATKNNQSGQRGGNLQTTARIRIPDQASYRSQARHEPYQQENKQTRGYARILGSPVQSADKPVVERRSDKFQSMGDSATGSKLAQRVIRHIPVERSVVRLLKRNSTQKGRRVLPRVCQEWYGDRSPRRSKQAKRCRIETMEHEASRTLCPGQQVKIRIRRLQLFVWHGQ